MSQSQLAPYRSRVRTYGGAAAIVVAVLGAGLALPYLVADPDPVAPTPVVPTVSVPTAPAQGEEPDVPSDLPEFGEPPADTDATTPTTIVELPEFGTDRRESGSDTSM
jgi:hypothetical protein